MKEQIKNIIESYCEGINHLEFNIADLDKMADEILALQLPQTSVMQSVCSNELDCPFDFTSRCTMGRCDCKSKQTVL